MDQVFESYGQDLRGSAFVVEGFGGGGVGGSFAAPADAFEVFAFFVQALTEGGECVGDFLGGGEDGEEAIPEGVDPWEGIGVSNGL